LTLFHQAADVLVIEILESLARALKRIGEEVVVLYPE
jgi:hypothetical protein